jgi:CSLREA domain-containing protein
MNPQNKQSMQIVTAHSWRIYLFSLSLILLAALSLPGLPVYANTITVNTTVDDIDVNGNCTLREAIRAANLDQPVDACSAGNGADKIVLQAGNYVLTLPGIDEDDALQGDLDITNDLIIDGADEAVTIIDANDLDRVFHVLTGDVQFSRVTITGGDVVYGGGLYVQDGTVILTNSRVTNNTAFQGGGIMALLEDSTLTLRRSVVSNNSADNGAGIVNGLSTMIITDSLVQDNTAVFDGGGISNLAANLIVVNSTISGNSAGEAGGGIYASAIAGNEATGLYNVTISNNSAFDGGGVFTETGFEDVFLQNSIVAGNFGNGGSGPDCNGTLISGGYNLIQSAVNCTILGDPTGNVTGVLPYLGPLQNNGGPTLTHAIYLSSSLAVDGGNPTGCVDTDNNLLATDQRGYVRPVDGNGDGVAHCDMGAYEFNSPGVPTPTPTATSTSTLEPSSTPTTTATATPTTTATPTPTTTATPTATTPPDPSQDVNVHLPLIVKSNN